MISLRLTRLVVTELVVLHLWPSIRHGIDHGALQVELPANKGHFVLWVVLVLPLVATFALWTRWVLPSLWVVGLAFVAASAFGIYHHYVLISPDNIRHLPDGSEHLHRAFISSAAWVAISETTTALITMGLALFWTRRKEGVQPEPRPTS